MDTTKNIYEQIEPGAAVQRNVLYVVGCFTICNKKPFHV